MQFWYRCKNSETDRHLALLWKKELTLSTVEPLCNKIRCLYACTPVSRLSLMGRTAKCHCYDAWYPEDRSKHELHYLNLLFGCHTFYTHCNAGVNTVQIYKWYLHAVGMCAKNKMLTHSSGGGGLPAAPQVPPMHPPPPASSQSCCPAGGPCLSGTIEPNPSL